MRSPSAIWRLAARTLSRLAILDEPASRCAMDSKTSAAHAGATVMGLNPKGPFSGQGRNGEYSAAMLSSKPRCRTAQSPFEPSFRDQLFNRAPIGRPGICGCGSKCGSKCDCDSACDPCSTPVADRLRLACDRSAFAELTLDISRALHSSSSSRACRQSSSNRHFITSRDCAHWRVVILVMRRIASSFFGSPPLI